MTAKRYDIGTTDRVIYDMMERVDGEYVKHEDYAKEIAANEFLTNYLKLHAKVFERNQSSIKELKAEISVLKGKLVVYMSNDVLVDENERLRAAIKLHRFDMVGVEVVTDRPFFIDSRLYKALEEEK